MWIVLCDEMGDPGPGGVGVDQVAPFLFHTREAAWEWTCRKITEYHDNEKCLAFDIDGEEPFTKIRAVPDHGIEIWAMVEDADYIDDPDEFESGWRRKKYSVTPIDVTD